MLGEDLRSLGIGVIMLLRLCLLLLEGILIHGLEEGVVRIDLGQEDHLHRKFSIMWRFCWVHYVLFNNWDSADLNSPAPLHDYEEDRRMTQEDLRTWAIAYSLSIEV